MSLVAGLVAALLVANLAARRARSAWAGLFAAALFVALSFPTQGPGQEYGWFSFYKEDMLGVTFALGAIAVLDRGGSRGEVVLAAILAALAVLTKQTLVAAGLAGFVWLLVRDRRMAALFAGISVGLVLTTSVALELSTHAFLANVVFANVNPLNEYVLQGNLGTLLQYQAAPLAITTVYLVAQLRDWRKAVGDIMVLYTLASLVSLLGLAKIGSNYNYWIDLGAISAILATQVIWGGLRVGLVPAGAIAIVSLCVLGAQLAIFLQGHSSLDLLGILPYEQQRDLRHPDEFNWVVERVREEPKDVLSESLDVVVLAGKPAVVEPIIFTIMVNGNEWMTAHSCVAFATETSGCSSSKGRWKVVPIKIATCTRASGRLAFWRRCAKRCNSRPSRQSCRCTDLAPDPRIWQRHPRPPRSALPVERA